MISYVIEIYIEVNILHRVACTYLFIRARIDRGEESDDEPERGSAKEESEGQASAKEERSPDDACIIKEKNSTVD